MTLAILYLMRGLPGSGKSTIAESLVGGECRNTKVENFAVKYGKNGVICSTDAYFYEDWYSEQNYVFNPKDIGKNHKMNQDAVEYCMNKEVPVIVVDNTNTTKWETSSYVRLAKRYQYKIVVVEVPHIDLDSCSARNTHDVPFESLKKMEDRWEMFVLPGTDGKFVNEK